MTMIDLGGVILNSSILTKQINQDIKDDWFQDPFCYQDLLTHSNIKEKIDSNIVRHSGRYIPSSTSLFDIPKKNFTVRYSIEKSIIDRVYFHGVCVFLIPFYDEIFSSRSFSHRYQYSSNQNDKYLFKNGVEQWKEYLGAVRAKSKGLFLLETDIHAYFENIEVREIKSCLIDLIPLTKSDGQEKLAIRRAIDLLCEALPHWTQNTEIQRGLPQNRDASSFLANAYMHDVDQNMIDAGFDYYRYMDDIKIVCHSEYQARKALLRLSRELREKRLWLNSKKTRILAPDEALLELEPSRQIDYIEGLLKSKDWIAVSNALNEIVELTLKLIKTGATQSREFRYCINKLEKIHRCKDFSLNRDVLKKVTRAIVKEMDKSPVSTDRYISYLMSCDLSKYQLNKLAEQVCDAERAIYSWQNYQIWKLFAYKKFNKISLRNYAYYLIKDEEVDPADRAGAILYIGRFGSKIQKLEIAKYFGTFDSFIEQRMGLIAIHELPFNEIKKWVKGKVHKDLEGMYQSLRKGRFNGKYHIPQEKIKMKQLFGYSELTSGE